MKAFHTKREVIKMKNTKDILVNEYFSAKSGDTKKADNFISSIETYLKKETDIELTLILHALKAQKADIDNKKFSECCTLALPIFEHLENTENDWGRIELHVLSVAITYHSDYNKTTELAREALDVLEDEEHIGNPEYRTMRTNIHSNLTLRMLRARYRDIDLNNPTEVAKLEAAFKYSYNYVMDICVRKNILAWQYILTARKGVFENKRELLEEGLSKLLKAGEKQKYKTTKDEVVEYLTHMKDLSKDLANFLTGYQVRKRRKELNMAPTDLAFALDTDQNVITSIERGDGGVSRKRLRSLAKILKVEIGYFEGDDSKKTEDIDPFMASIEACMHSATNEDKENALKVLQLMMNMKYPERGKKKKRKPK